MPDFDRPEAQSTIAEGAESAPSQNGVVSIRYNFGPGSNRYCTGAMVAPNIVATALSCIAEFSKEPYFCRADGTTIGEPEAGAIDGLLDLSRLQVRVGFEFAFDQAPDATALQVVAPDADRLCGNDVAFVLLDAELSVNVLPMRIDGPPILGESFTAIGYGSTNPDPLNTNFTVERHYRSGLTVDEVMPPEPDPESTKEGLAPRTFGAPPILCGGDSGGPALSEHGAVIGLATANIGQTGLLCGAERSVYTQVAPFKDLVEEVFALTPYRIWREGEPAPLSVPAGGGCLRDDNCVGQRCDQRGPDAEEGICAATCDLDGDCDEGFECVFDDGANSGYCELSPPSSGLVSDGCSLADRAPGRSRPSAWGLLGLALLRRRR